MMGMPHTYRPMQSCEENHVLSKSYCNPPGINQSCAFLMQSLEIACEKDILKICFWDFSYSVVNKSVKHVKCQDFFVPLQSGLILDLISCSSKSKSLIVVNLLIGIAEDQDHLEKYFDKRIKGTYGTVSTKNGIFSRRQK